MIILIAEDAPEVVRLWRVMLASVCREFRVADTIAGAIVEMAREPLPDLVLLDLTLKDSGAEDTLSHVNELKRLNPAAVVFVITGASDPALKELAEKVGADGFAHKAEMPIQDNLFRAVRQAFKTHIERDVAAGRDVKPYERRAELLERLTLLTTKPDAAVS